MNLVKYVKHTNPKRNLNNLFGVHKFMVFIVFYGYSALKSILLFSIDLLTFIQKS